ncbi:MAG: HAD family hydrolase [Faecalibacterium sp.]
MTQKLVFLDVDGTLLAPGDMAIPASAVDAMRRARANGHKLFVCTGRNYRMTEPLLAYGFDGFICSAGGYVCCGDKILADIPMQPEQVQGLCKAMQAHGVECTLEAKDDTFGGMKMIERFAPLAKVTETALNSEAQRWRKAMAEGMTIRPLNEYSGQPIYKIVYIAEHVQDLDEARAKYEDQFVFCESHIDALSGGFVNGELINRRFSKGSGIRAICQELGVSLEDTIGFGDSDNDLQMAETVAVSVCMANGSERLREICTHICPSVQEDGIAKAFAELGLI